MAATGFKVEFPRRQAMLSIMEPVYKDTLCGEICVGEKEVGRAPVLVWPMPTSEGLFLVEHQDGTVQRVQPDSLTFLGSKELFDQYYEWIPSDASSFPARVRLRNTAWMVYYEPDVVVQRAQAEKAALCARIDELCAEVERLRQLADGAANEADRLTHDAAALQVENAKLRTALSAVIQCNGITKRDKGCDACPMYDKEKEYVWAGDWCGIKQFIRELRVEVD